MSTRRFFLVSVFSFTVLLGFSHALGSQCIESFETIQASSSSSLNDSELSALTSLTSSLSLSSRVGSRGLLSAYPEATDGLEAALKAKAVVWWGIEVFVVHSEAEAKAHDQSVDYAYDQGVYLISNSVRPEELDVKNRDQGPTLFQRILTEKPRVIWFKNPSADSPKSERVQVEIPQDQVTQLFNPSEVLLRTRKLSLGPHFLAQGWFYPADTYGVFEFKDLKDSKNTYKTLLSRARKLYREGHRVQFSQTEAEFLEDLMIASNTSRADQDTVGNGYYSRETNRTEALRLFAKGEAFSVRVTQNGRSQGGIIVKRAGNLIDFETTFYSEVGGILYSQVAALALFDRLEQVGLSKLYIDMISRYSHSLKAKAAPIQEGVTANTELSQKPPLPFDFKSEWIPPGL